MMLKSFRLEHIISLGEIRLYRIRAEDLHIKNVIDLPRDGKRNSCSG